MPSRLRLAALSLFLTAAQQPPGASDTIEVIGRAPEEARREAQAFVRRLGVTERPVARFVDPVCPHTIGLAKPLASRVETRVREIARQAGVRTAAGPCKPNLVIAFVTGSDAVIERVSKRMPGRADAIRIGVWDALKASPAPIRWWHLTADRTADGMRGGGNDVPPAIGGMVAGPNAPPLGGQVYQQYTSSLSSTKMMRVLAASSVIVDADRATGLPLDSVVDYAALVGLAEVRFGEEPPPASVLSLFAPAGPRTLTTLDQTFLRTLYKLPLDRTAVAHRGLLVRGLLGTDEQLRDD